MAWKPDYAGVLRRGWHRSAQLGRCTVRLRMVAQAFGARGPDILCQRVRWSSHLGTHSLALSNRRHLRSLQAKPCKRPSPHSDPQSTLQCGVGVAPRMRLAGARPQSSAQAGRQPRRRRLTLGSRRGPNGRPPGPGRRYAIHFHRPGPGALPFDPPHLER